MRIEDLVEEAEETMLTAGKVMPMAYIELGEDVVLILAFDALSDAQSIPAQGGLLARHAWEKCKEHPGKAPHAIGFYAEAWRSNDARTLDERMRPSTSAKREEILSVDCWQANGTPQYQHASVPVLRDHKKRVVGFGDEERIEDKPSMQIAALVKGASDAQRPDEEVMAEMKQQIAAHMATLSPAQRKGLAAFLAKEMR